LFVYDEKRFYNIACWLFYGMTWQLFDEILTENKKKRERFEDVNEIYNNLEMEEKNFVQGPML
jgi:hypothetical protein